MKVLSIFILSLLTAAGISGCGTDTAEPNPSEQTESETEEREEVEEVEEVEFPHIHGLGFTEDGLKAFVPAHDGLRVFENGIWSRVEGPRHDYMGFSMTSDGFYSSGHPSLQTDYENPLGIIKSTDEGKSIEVLDLEGEVDFHLMTAGYNSGAIYVLNPHQNSEMDNTGLYVTTNEAKDWEKGDISSITGNIIAMAAHPDKQGVVAISTERGVFLSQDSGNSFEQIFSDGPVPALSFTHDDQLLAAVGIGRDTTLQMIDPAGETQQKSAPEVQEEDAISYIAQHPESLETIMVTTMERDVFYTEDQGETWEQTVKEGKSKNNS